jgi:hypothetical protein
MRPARATIVIRMPPELSEGLKLVAEMQGENVATVVRTLARGAIERAGVSENMAPRQVAALRRGVAAMGAMTSPFGSDPIPPAARGLK